MILRDQHEEKVYSDGETVEAEMLRIAEVYPEDASQDYIASDSRYTINNTFSSVRRNILNWYPFKQDCSILEVGAGMGSLTGLLCDVAKSVTALEMSEARASVIKARYPERSNLEILSADINEWEDDREYDYVVVIGVMEYAAIFSDAQNPYVEFIQSLGRHLKSDGKVLLAIENRFGIKYFSGASEDHLQSPFVGLEGYENKGPRTFSKYELEKQFERAGFLNHRTYLVFPDYKFPEIICTEEKLPDYQSLQKLSFTHGNNSVLLYDEKKLYKDIIENGTLPFFANSFLVEASRESLNEVHPVYISARSETKKEYRIDTIIYNDSCLEKVAVHPKAISHLHNIEKITKDLTTRGVSIATARVKDGRLVCDYVEGESVQKIFSRALENNDKDTIYTLIDELRDNIIISSDITKEQPDEIFGVISKEALGEVLENGYVDMTFYNAVIANAKMVFFDQEWNFPNVPLKFILYYALKSAYFRCNVNTNILFEHLLKYIGVSDDMLGPFDGFESKMWENIILRGGDKYGADGYCNLYHAQTEGYQEVCRRIKQGDIKGVVSDYYKKDKLDIAEQRILTLEQEITSLQNLYAETDTKLNAIEHAIGWRIVSAPGKIYECSKNIFRRTGQIVIGYFKAVNITNIKFVISAFKKGGIKQVRKELRAFEHRQTGIEEPFDKPEIYPQIHEKDWDKLETLEIPNQENPKVSIIIPVYNQIEYTYNCIKSIINHSKDIAYEIIVADDCSTDKTTDLANKVRNVRVIRNEHNLKFLLNCNNAAKEARGEYILFLNNDTQVMEDWLSPLVALIESDAKIGMVGSKLIYPDGALQEAGGILWKDGSAWNYGNGKNPERSEFNYVKETDYISGAAMMIKADLWREIGGFDERFVPAYCEDSDLAFEVRKHGYKVMYQPKSVVVHFEGVSNGTDVNTGLKKYQVENSNKFCDKWKDVLKKEHFDNGYNVFQARDKSAQRKCILFVDHYAPQFDRDAGSRTVFAYLKLFTKKGFNVKFIGDNFFREEPYTEALQQMGVEVLYGPEYAQSWKDWIEENAEAFDYVFLNRPHISKNYIDFVKEHTKAKIIYYGHDLHYVRETREYELTGNEELLKSAEEWKSLEYYLMEQADVVYYPSQVEVDEIKRNNASINASALTAYIYPDLKEREYDYSSRKNLLFVGGFGHGPNIDAVKWFVSDVFPKVLKQNPDIVFEIVGSKAPNEIMSLASDNVVVHGFVSDERLEELYSTCKMAVIPLRYGAGIKGKVVEAMSQGVPVVTTSVGAEGIINAEDILFIEDDADKFADLICEVYNDSSSLKKASEESYMYIKEYYSEEAAWDGIKEEFE